MKNFQNYTPEKYRSPAFEEVEPGIYLAPNPYRNIDNREKIYVTSLSFEMEPDQYGEEDGCPQDITQIPFEDILDDFSVYVTDFYDELNQSSETTCYQEFGSSGIENIRNLRSLIGKRFYAAPYEDGEDEDEEYEIVIE